MWWEIHVYGQQKKPTNNYYEPESNK